MSNHEPVIDRLQDTDSADVFFAEHMGAVMAAARKRLSLEREGQNPDSVGLDGRPEHDGTQVMIPLSGTTSAEVRQANINHATLQVAARTITRWALLRDEAETGSLVSRTLARVELAASSIMDRPYVGGAASSVRRPGGIVDKVRDKKAV